jgi:hypothetical protein
MPAPAPAQKNSPHRWSFYRAGGVDQVRLDSGADIFNLDQLDQKLWVALSCPVKGLEFDSRTLALLDADHDDHVRPPEILAAIAWLRQVLKSGDDLIKGQDGAALANIRTDTDEGKAVLASIKHILSGLGKEKASVITIDDATKTAELFAKAKHNGDGIVPAGAVDDAAAQQVAQEIVDCLGGTQDRSGAPGFDQAKLEQFFADCAAFDGWWKKAESDAKTVLPFGEATPAALTALEAVRAKIDDYFGRARLAAFDPRVQGLVNRDERSYAEIVGKDLSLSAMEVAHFPLAIVEAGRALRLTAAMNPAWSAAVARFRATCCQDKAELTEAEWTALCSRLDAHKAWAANKAGGTVEKLGLTRVREILAGKSKDVLAKAIADDLAVAPQIDTMVKVEKLVRLHRDLYRLLNNYVCFSDFYARRGAIFQAGTLMLDGRACDMSFHVTDAGKHAKLAPMSNSYLAYVDCTRPGSEKMSVACAFTAGDSDNLFEGRNGIFYDRKGRDWDATITKIVSNPISIKQAFWSPYKKVLRSIQEAVAKKAAAADEAATGKLAAGAAAVGEAAKTGAAPPKPKFDIGMVAALGVAVGGISTALAGLLAGFFGLGPWIPVGILGVLLAISGPSMFIAWLKLRQRNLGPILDANGWAVNTLTKVNIPLGGSLTAMPKIPAGSHRSLVDPYAPKKSPWPKILFALLVLAGIAYALYRTNLLYRWLPQYEWLEHVSASFDGPDVATVGVDEVRVRLGSGAAFVTVSGLEGVTQLPVDPVAKAVRVPMANAKADAVITLTDATTMQTHLIKVVAKK